MLFSSTNDFIGHALMQYYIHNLIPTNTYLQLLFVYEILIVLTDYKSSFSFVLAIFKLLIFVYKYTLVQFFFF